MDVRFGAGAEGVLSAVSGVTDPERKRKIIGRVFIEVFDREAKKIKRRRISRPGDLYPDLIESRSASGGPSAVIKSHHNVGGFPKRMKLKLVDAEASLQGRGPALGKELGMSDDVIWRQPFPGPGLRGADHTAR